MRAGKLDRPITIERATTAIDDAGTPQTTWATVATLRAQIITQSAQEFIRAEGGGTSENAIVFRTRYVEGVQLDDRVTYEGASFDVKETKEIGRRRGLEIRCIAWVS
jgi:SPP1 family predicted phage head-tail adaptor